jgi:hypothetical protein
MLNGRFLSVQLCVASFTVSVVCALAEPPRLYFPDMEYHNPGKFAGKVGPPSIESHERLNYHLAFVEFDQRGDFWDRQQLAYAAGAIKEVGKGGKPILLIEYVHGWHNNANELDVRENPAESIRDVAKFKQFLAIVAQSPFVQKLHYRVFGVYIGWRGEIWRQDDRNLLTEPVWISHNLSFYREKGIGTNVGTMPMVTEAIFWLVHEARRTSPNSHTVLIGHSFGALVLENALSQAIASSVSGTPYEAQHSAGASLYSPADLVLLLNSAADSMRAKGLQDMLSRIGSSASQYIDKTRPLVVSVTSTGDEATGFFFPLGTGLSNALVHFRDYNPAKPNGSPISQRYFVTHTPGHNDYLITHTVCPSKDIAGSLPLPNEDASPPRSERSLFQEAFEDNLEKPIVPQDTGWNRKWSFRCVGKNGICLATIVPKEDAAHKTPYWIIQVPPSIIKDHSDIFNQQSLCLYAALFRISSPTREPATPPPARLMQLLSPALQ